MNTPTIETDRLELRKIEDKDTKCLFSIFSNSEAMRYWDTKPHESISVTKEALSNMENIMVGGRGLSWGIILKDTSQLIGYFGLHSWNHNNDKTELGYIINPSYWGKGIGSEVLKSVIEFCFSKMRFKTILAEVDPNNYKSINILINHGFVLVEEKKNDISIQDKYYDTNVYELNKKSE